MTVLSLLRRVGRFFYLRNELASYEVYVFVGEATTAEHNASGYPAGKKYAILVFSRQLKGAEPDWELPQSDLEAAGWVDVQLKEGGKVNPKKNAAAVDTSRSAYVSALKNGSAVVVYPEGSDVTNKNEEDEAI
jgi:hypothetical protein